MGHLMPGKARTLYSVRRDVKTSDWSWHKFSVGVFIRGLGDIKPFLGRLWLSRWSRSFKVRLLQSACWSVLGQDTAPQMEYMYIYLNVCEWVNVTRSVHVCGPFTISNPWQYVNGAHINTMCKVGQKLTLFGHSHGKALLQAAVLTAVPCHLVDNAVLLPVTCIHHVLLDASAEKTLRRRTQTEKGVHVHEKKSFHINLIFWS